MYAVIIAGGKGERLWPKSAKGNSKHMLSFGTKNALIQGTIKRLRQYLPLENILIVTTKKQFSSLKQYTSMLKKENIILEPEGKDTAVAISLAALLIEKRFGDSTMVVLPTDHIIKNSGAFFKNLRAAEKIADTGPVLVTIGIKPRHASVGYGYIETGRHLIGYYAVRRFTEKPKKKKAEKIYKKSSYLWNSGIFIWKTSSILAAFKRYMPDVYYGMKDAMEFMGKKSYSMKLANEYARFKNISIDYGVIEPASKDSGQKIFCIKAGFDWVDIGSWSSVEEIYDKDSNGNIILSSTALIDVKDSIIIGERGHKIGLIGVKDLIIVQTKSGTLVCKKNRAQEVKQLVKGF